jgi:hypothetical protein
VQIGYDLKNHMKNSKELNYAISWMLGFEAAANWKLTPILERKYDPITRECVNGAQRIYPKDKDYTDPYDAYEKEFNRKFPSK